MEIISLTLSRTYPVSVIIMIIPPKNCIQGHHHHQGGHHHHQEAILLANPRLANANQYLLGTLLSFS